LKSCLPDSEGRYSARETDGSRPSPFSDGALRTTGAPKSVTPGAQNAPDAAESAPPTPVGSARPGTERTLPDPLPSFLEACGKLASEAVARGDARRARELTELAASAAAARVND
jgi:hypothetical protein